LLLSCVFCGLSPTLLRFPLISLIAYLLTTVEEGLIIHHLDKGSVAPDIRPPSESVYHSGSFIGNTNLKTVAGIGYCQRYDALTMGNKPYTQTRSFPEASLMPVYQSDLFVQSVSNMSKTVLKQRKKIQHADCRRSIMSTPAMLPPGQQLSVGIGWGLLTARGQLRGARFNFTLVCSRCLFTPKLEGTKYEYRKHNT
jgi:hypothetical protein